LDSQLEIPYRSSESIRIRRQSSSPASLLMSNFADLGAAQGRRSHGTDGAFRVPSSSAARGLRRCATGQRAV